MAMSKQSSVVKAGKTIPKQRHDTAKEVAHVAKSSLPGKKMTLKAARLDAKARARAWAKRELGQRNGRKSQSRPQVSAAASARSVSVNDDDDDSEDVVDLTKSKSINKEMVETLDRIGKSDNQFIVDDISEDVFYDAMEFLDEDKTQEDVVVEDASDDDEELFSLRSSIRNQMPTKSWMEPVGVLYSAVMGVKKPDPESESEHVCI